MACRAGSVIARIAAYCSWSRAVTRSCCRRCSSHEATMNCSRIRPGSALSCHVRQALDPRLPPAASATAQRVVRQCPCSLEALVLEQACDKASVECVSCANSVYYPPGSLARDDDRCLVRTSACHGPTGVIANLTTRGPRPMRATPASAGSSSPVSNAASCRLAVTIDALATRFRSTGAAGTCGLGQHTRGCPAGLGQRGRYTGDVDNRFRGQSFQRGAHVIGCQA